tara:strand:- start:1062 stop:1718 length:657 start_codon:yes stop_codon:yes gene_type:complete
MSYYSGLTHRKPSNYKNMSSTQMNSYQQPNSYQNSYHKYNQGFENRDDIDYNYNYDESENEEEISLDCDYDSNDDSNDNSNYNYDSNSSYNSNCKNNLETMTQNKKNQLRGEVNLYQNSNNKQQNYHIGNEITNPRGLGPDEKGFYNSYGEYEIKYQNEGYDQKNIDLEKNDLGCTVLGSSSNNNHQSLFNRVENYYSYLEENMSQAINNLKDLVLNN